MYMIRFSHWDNGQLVVYYVKSLEVMDNLTRGLAQYKLTDIDNDIMYLTVAHTIVSRIDTVYVNPHDIDGSEAVWRLQHSHAE